MHDPMSVAFEIPTWGRVNLVDRVLVVTPRWRRPIVTIWHRDAGGVDGACDHTTRRWRWHLHHWRIQIHFLQRLRRWLFTRCGTCGERFTWGFAPVSDRWEPRRSRWPWQGEKDLYHSKCCPGGP